MQLVVIAFGERSTSRPAVVGRLKKWLVGGALQRFARVLLALYLAWVAAAKSFGVGPS